MKKYVFDTYALAAYVNDEPAAEIVSRLLGQTLTNEVMISMSCVNLGEFFYICLRKFGEERAKVFYDFYKEFPINRIIADESLCLEAAAFKADHKMSYADAFAAALAYVQSATLVTGDPEFKPFEKKIDTLWLPVKPKSGKRKKPSSR